MRITPIIASRFTADGGAMFGLVPKPIWSKRIRPDEHNAIPQHGNALLVELNDARRGLIETGCGPAERFSEKERRLNGLSEGWPLQEALIDLNIDFDDIDFIILTHLHWDHAGGAGNAKSDPAFPKALHYIHRREWETANANNPLLYKSYPPSTLAPLHKIDPKQLRLVDDERPEILPGIQFIRTGGHTVGHCMVRLKDECLAIQHPRADAFSEGSSLIFCGDVCPTRFHLRLVFQTAYDTFPIDTRAWKRSWLPRITREKTGLFFSHDPGLFGATLQADEREEYVVDQTWAAYNG